MGKLSSYDTAVPDDDDLFPFVDAQTGENKKSLGSDLPGSGSGSGTPGGSNTQVQFNDSSAFGGDSGLTYNKTTDTLTAGQIIDSGLTASRAMVTDGSKQLSSSATTATELGYVSGVTSALQTQIDAKASTTTFNDHSARHENGGADEISIAGLDGIPTELTNHLNDASDAHDASAISILDSGGNYTATDVEGALAEVDNRITSEIATHDSDPDAHSEAFNQYNEMNLFASPDILGSYTVTMDDFPNLGATSGQIGTLGWSISLNDTGAGLAPLTAGAAGSAGAPSVFQLSTGTGDTTAAAGINLGKIQLYGAPEFIWEARVYMPSLNDGSQNYTWQAGLHTNTNAASIATPVHGFYFEYTSADTTIHCITTSDSTPDDKDSGFVAPEDTWFTIRIVCDGGGTVYFYINDMETPVTTHTDANSIPDNASGDGYGRAFMVDKTLGTGTVRSLMIDYEYFKRARV